MSQRFVDTLAGALLGILAAPFVWAMSIMLINWALTK